MNTSGDSKIDQFRVEWAMRLRYSPMPSLTMEGLAAYLNQFRIGELRPAARTWEIMTERDIELGADSIKRYETVGGFEWDVLAEDDSDEAMAHQEALKYFYNHLQATSALEANEIGDLSLFMQQVASAIGNRYSTHEMLLRVDNAARKRVTAVMRHCPVWFFECRRGYLGYLEQIFDVYGAPLAPGEWVTAVGYGHMRPCSVGYLMKGLSLKDAMVFSARFGLPGIHGETSATKGSTEWADFAEALRQFANDWVTVTNPGAKINLIEAAKGGSGTLPFEGMVDLVNRGYSKLFRGSDLATTSRKNAVGSEMQQGETDVLNKRDGRWLTGIFNTQIDRPVIDYLFGTEPKAWFKVKVEDEVDTEEHIKTATFLLNNGARIGMKTAQERLNWPEPKAGEEVLEPGQAGGGRQEAGDRGQGAEVRDQETRGRGDAGMRSADVAAKLAAAEQQPANHEAETKPDAKTDFLETEREIQEAQGKYAFYGRSPIAAAGARQTWAEPRPEGQGKRQGAEGKKNAGPFAVGNAREAREEDFPGMGELLDGAAEAFAKAQAEVLRPIRERVMRIAEVSDPEAQKAAMEKLRDDLPRLLKEMNTAPRTAKVLEEALNAALIAGWENGSRERPNNNETLSFGRAAKAANGEKTTDDTDHTDKAIENGGPSSGNFGHLGRPGQVGGSGPGGSTQAQQKILDVLNGKSEETAYAPVTADEARRIREATKAAGHELDVTGYQHFTDKGALIHINKEHGIGREKEPGNIGLTQNDVLKIPEIVSKPDTVEYGGESSRGLPTIKYSKRFNGTVYYVEEHWRTEKLLATKTMYKVKA